MRSSEIKGGKIKRKPGRRSTQHGEKAGGPTSFLAGGVKKQMWGRECSPTPHLERGLVPREKLSGIVRFRSKGTFEEKEKEKGSIEGRRLEYFAAPDRGGRAIGSLGRKEKKVPRGKKRREGKGGEPFFLSRKKKNGESPPEPYRFPRGESGCWRRGSAREREGQGGGGRLAHGIGRGKKETKGKKRKARLEMKSEISCGGGGKMLEERPREGRGGLGKGKHPLVERKKGKRTFKAALSVRKKRKEDF